MGYGKLKVVLKHLEDGCLACRLVVLLWHSHKLCNQRYVAKLECKVVVGVRAMEVGTSLVGIAHIIGKTLNLVYIREHRVGILNHGKALVPKALHIVAVATASHTRCRSKLGIKVVLETATHIGLGIHANIRHKIVGSQTNVVPVVVDDVCLELLVALSKRSLQTSLCTICSTWLVERKRVLLQEVVTARNHRSCQSYEQTTSI